MKNYLMFEFNIMFMVNKLLLIAFLFIFIPFVKAELWQSTLYTFCNTTFSGSSDVVCGLGRYQLYNGNMELVDLLPVKSYANTFTSYALDDYCLSDYFETYVVQTNYVCSSTVSGSITNTVYIANSTHEVPVTFTSSLPAICDGSIHQLNTNADIRQFKNLHPEYESFNRVFHNVSFDYLSGSGQVMIETFGYLSCLKNSTQTKYLNVNGGFSETKNGLYTGVGFKELPYYLDGSQGRTFLYNGMLNNYNYPAYDFVKPLDFFVPNVSNVYVSYDTNCIFSQTHTVVLTNGYDYYNSTTAGTNSNVWQTMSFVYPMNASSPYRKFSLTINPMPRYCKFDNLYVAFDNLVESYTPPTTTTTTTTTPTVTTTTLPSNVDAQISQITISDNNPTIGQEVSVKIKITNTGQGSWNFPVGLSIGKNSIYCNRDCYTDGKGDYVYTGLIHSGQTVEVERTFKFRQEYFDEGGSYDLKAGVYAFTYMPPSQAYDYKTLSDYITIATLEQKLNTYAIHAKASKQKVAKEDVVDITAYVLNNGTASYNFTIGMSIGIWDTQTGVFKSYKTPLTVPCNLECYADDKGEWIYAIIPPNYTDPVKRSFRIPDYFLNDNPFDVAIGIYTKPPQQGGKLISITYIKNVSYTTTQPSMTQTLAGYVKSSIDAFILLATNAFGVGVSSAKILFVVFVEMLVIYLVYSYNKTGVDNRVAILALVMLMTFGFTAIGWFPLVLSIIVILVCGLLLYNIIRG